jgi:endonuclease/exonuclease/phosphatase family metal-dependent hydrolase
MTNRHVSFRTVIVLSFAVAIGATAVSAETSSAQGAAPQARASARRSVDIRAASFNVQSVGVDRTAGARRPWKARRATVIREILQERVDVVGVQELNPSNYFARRVVGASNQMLDLRNGLNRAGGHYALNSTAAANCVNADTNYHCKYRYRAASYSERILYNTRTLSMVTRGFQKYASQDPRYRGAGLVWAVLRSRADGHQFLFTSTHLDSVNRSRRVAQWKQLIASVRRLKAGMPVISVGDFNTEKFDPVTRTLLPAMKHAGFGDILNQQFHVNPSRGVRAKRRINTWVSSNNHSSRNVRSYGYARARTKIGNSIDYIFASNSLRVKEYKVVLNFDPRTLRVRGTLPSDHNMLRATITLP